MPGPMDGYKWDGTSTGVYCQECGTCIFIVVAAKEIRERLETGEYREGTRYVKVKNFDGGHTYNETNGIWAICDKCRRNDRATLDLRGAEVATRTQAARIQERMRHIRRRNPQMSITEAAARATEDEFEPRNEPNLAFRAYLLERYTPSTIERSLWKVMREALRRLFA